MSSFENPVYASLFKSIVSRVIISIFLFNILQNSWIAFKARTKFLSKSGESHKVSLKISCIISLCASRMSSKLLALHALEKNLFQCGWMASAFSYYIKLLINVFILCTIKCVVLKLEFGTSFKDINPVHACVILNSHILHISKNLNKTCYFFFKSELRTIVIGNFNTTSKLIASPKNISRRSVRCGDSPFCIPYNSDIKLLSLNDII